MPPKKSEQESGVFVQKRGERLVASDMARAPHGTIVDHETKWECRHPEHREFFPKLSERLVRYCVGSKPCGCRGIASHRVHEIVAR